MDRKNWIWILVVVLVLVIFYVFGWFGNEPLLAPFDATVSLSNAPPIIFSIVEVADEVGASPRTGIVDPVSGITVSTDISFIADDPNGQGDIASATVQYTGPAPGNTLRPAAPVACAVVAGCPAGCTANQRQYRCTITLNYYDDFSLAADDWDVSIVVTDQGALSATCSRSVTTGCGASIDVTEEGGSPDTQVEFVYNQLKSLDINANCPPDTSCSSSWIGVSLITTDQIADGHMLMLNLGNVLLNNMQILAKNLDGVTNPTVFIPSDSFGVSSLTGGGGCTEGTPGTCLECNWNGAEPPVNAFRVPAEGAPAVSIGFSTNPTYGLQVPVGASGSNQEQTYFCISESLSGLEPQSYAATGANQWLINVV